MSAVTVAILTAKEARELRLQAQAVLRTLSNRKRCECERPWRDVDAYCGRCGRWIESTKLAKALRRYIETMEQVERPDPGWELQEAA